MHAPTVRQTLPTLILTVILLIAAPLVFTSVTAELSSKAPTAKPFVYTSPPAIESMPYEWVHQYPLISHALGGIGGHIGTNSLEALLQAYRSGHRVFETDLCITSDGHLVLRHDWEAGTYPVIGPKAAQSNQADDAEAI